MNKTILTYGSLALASVVVIVTFITATTYLQLAAASLLYPALIFFAYKVLPLRPGYALKKDGVAVHPHVTSEAKTQSVGISDIDKRAFLKLIGATGLSFFLISVFGRRIEALLFGQNLVKVPGGIGGPIGTAIASSPTDGYKISEIDDNIVGYYGFINKEGGWFIMMEDTNSGSFRYAKGDSDFPGNWKKRESLKYDYFHNVFF